MPSDCTIDDPAFDVEQVDFDADRNEDNYAGMDTALPMTPTPSSMRTHLAQSRIPGSMSSTMSKSYQKEKALKMFWRR
jgi:hypothetical protein